MARTSKRKVRLESQSLQESVLVKTYMAGIYTRLSVNHHDGKEVSIENQIEMAKEYLKSHTEITLYDCYSDLGATGTNFERSDFERLMQDVRDGWINCVIVKDFSRLGRNYIETGNFVEKIFSFMGVRFIAITEQYDSIKQMDCNQALSMHLKNIANELYARDIAEKVTASKRMKMERGEYIGGVPPYGYMVEKISGKRTLVPEPVTSEIVKQLFEHYDSGETFVSLTKWLYEQKIHRPGDYKKYKTVYQQEGQKLSQWGRETIRFILTSAVYVGTLVQSSKYVEEPMTVEHTHEPLVSDETFYRVWKRMEGNIKIQNRRPLRKDTMEDVFRSVLYCGECGHKLGRMVTERKTSYKEVKTFVFYGCPNIKRIDEEKCKSEHITFLQLQKIILQTLKKEFAFSSIQMKKLTTFNKEQAEKRKMQIRKTQNDLQKSVDGTDVRISSCYLEYRNGTMTQAQFLEEKKRLEEKREQDQRTLKGLHIRYSSIDREVEKQNQCIGTVVKCREQTKLTAELVQNLIERIEVYDNKRVKIIWKWKDEVGKVLGGTCDEK